MSPPLPMPSESSGYIVRPAVSPPATPRPRLLRPLLLPAARLPMKPISSSGSSVDVSVVTVGGGRRALPVLSDEVTEAVDGLAVAGGVCAWAAFAALGGDGVSVAVVLFCAFCFPFCRLPAADAKMSSISAPAATAVTVDAVLACLFPAATATLSAALRLPADICLVDASAAALEGGGEVDALDVGCCFALGDTVDGWDVVAGLLIDVFLFAALKTR